MRFLRRLRTVDLLFGSFISILGLCAAASAQTSPPTCTLTLSKAGGPAPLNIDAAGTCTQGTLSLSTLTLDFGDGTAPITQQEAPGTRQDTIARNHTYTNPNASTYSVTVTATDVGGQRGQASQSVSVNASPTCTFTVDKNIGPAPLTITANVSCTDPESDIRSATINWADGTVTNLVCDGTCRPFQGTHTYTTPGNYSAEARAADAYTSFAVTRQITAQGAPPTCTLILDKQSGSAPLTVNASGSNCSSTITKVQTADIKWGDGTSNSLSCDRSCDFQGGHTYPNPGTYTVTLQGTDDLQTTSSTSKTVTVADSTPSCTLSSNKNSGVNPLTVIFSGSCTDAGNDISSAGSSASLAFGDNTAPQSISTASGGAFSNVSHVYQSPGLYTATYTVTDDTRYTGTATRAVTVTQNQPPNCTLTLDTNQGTAPLTVIATANCTDPDDNVNTASIDWGDGSAPQALSCDGSCGFRGPHTYTAPGTYMMVVTGTDAAGLKGSANQTVTVNQPVDSTPKCSLNSDSQNGAAPLTVTFRGSCQDAGNDLGQGSTGTLDFGDKTTPQQVSPASFSNVTHVYQTAQTYTATFTATDSTQHTGTASLTITVTTPVDSTPMCTLNSDKQTGQAPLTVNFTGSCTDAGNDLIASSQSFDFNDGSPAQSGTSASHTYLQAGTYHPVFSASDTHGNKGSTSQTITVTAAPPTPNQPPSCTLTVSPSSGQAPLTVAATGSCTDPENDISSTTLNFGDGTVQSGTSGTHSYSQAGAFTVTVSATDTGGLQGSASQTVTVSPAPPPPNQPPSCTLIVNPTTGLLPLTVTATGSCTDPENDITSTTLDFGDDATISTGSGTHTYTQAGAFTVKVTATDALGLSGSATQNVTVSASKFAQGVFVGILGGTLMQFAADGSVLKTLSTGLGGTVAGMAFDSAGTLYATDFTAGNISRFDLKAGTLSGTFGSGFNCKPESIVFDGAGNAYVGQAGCSLNLLKFDPSGKLLATYKVTTEEQGSDNVDLSADQCTLLYTSEGPSILRYDVCRNQQMTPFATGLKKALTLRILPDGGVIVGDLVDIVRLNASGQPVMTYTASGEQCLYSVTLDQDGTSFWAADFCSSNVYRFDIGSGKQLSKFNTGTPSGTIFGLAIAGTGLNVAGLGNAGSMTASPGTATVAAGQSATFTVSFTPNAAAAGKTLTLSCASLPPGLTCSFTPSTLTLGAAGTTSTATLTITRTTTAALLHPSSPWMLATWLGVLPAVVLVGIGSPRRRRGSLLWLGLIVVASTGIWASCGGGGMSRTTSPQPTPQGAYTVIVVGNASGAQASTTVNLTVQ